MAKINVLDFHVANMIAAGEVVDRPASAVKELLENAIDAGADEITVEIKRGGITFIRVSDNGCGMTRDDVRLSVLRHATSKIRDAADLDGIMTLGFRGEALAAISAVSKMRIMTKTAEETVGTLLESCNGEITDITDAGCREGTTVIVEELFANVPARRKFLKKDASEGLAVGAVVEKIALSRPDIAIAFIADNQRKFATEGDGKLINAIYAVLGRDFAKKSAKVSGMTDGVEVEGYIGRPDNTRANRNCQNFFINGRYVKSRTAAAALEAAFDSYIPSDRFPTCVLNIILHPAYVDVNVHPAKLEVKFSNEKIVFDAIYSSVRNTLTEHLDRPRVTMEPGMLTGENVRGLNPFVPIYDPYTNDEDKTKAAQSKIAFDEPRLTSPDEGIPSLPPKDEVSPKEKPRQESPAVLEENEPTIDQLVPPLRPYQAPVSENPASEEIPVIPLDVMPDLNLDLSAYVKESEPQPAAEAMPAESNYVRPSEERRSPELKVPHYKMLGEAFNSYVFIELGDTVLMIDKHAAHERIIFEEMKRNMQVGASYSQVLLIPIELHMTPEECASLIEYADEIKSCGFDYTVREHQQINVEITQIPAALDQNQAQTLLATIAGRLADGTGTVDTSRESFYEKALYQASCKAAIKAGRIYAEENIRWICDRLLSLTDIKVCPHGRPVAIEMSKHDIEKQFKRI